MQDCFRQHPEVYSAELAGDEEDEPPEGADGEAPPARPNIEKEQLGKEQQASQETPAPASSAKTQDEKKAVTTQDADQPTKPAKIDSDAVDMEGKKE